jgi:ribonuclease PH
MRSFKRTAAQMRPFSFDLKFNQNAPGSVLMSLGRTKVLCTAYLEDRVPKFLKGEGGGWISAEYGMLPGATHQRGAREASRGKQGGRTLEIQRLIGRSLRAAIALPVLGEKSVSVDCDVLQADGGTRTASITGAYLAAAMCLWRYRSQFSSCPLTMPVGAISLGLKNGELLTDLDYQEDSTCDVDCNVVMGPQGRLIEIQGTAEHHWFAFQDVHHILEQGKEAIDRLIEAQREVLQAEGVDPAWIK